MRWILVVVAMIATAEAASAQQVWISACQDGKDAQYTQTIDGKGSFNLPNGDGTFTVIPVKQSFYNGAIVCGSTGVQNASQIGQVCADTNRNVIAVMSSTDIAKHLAPQDAAIYCSASVSVH